MLAIVKNLAARKLHQEAEIVHGQDPWTWLAVANFYLEQNPVDVADSSSPSLRHDAG
jgi:hypothetical protein